jgi:hypothetical protein
MARTAIKLHENCIPGWNDIKIGQKPRYVIVDFSKDQQYVVAEKAAPKESNYDTLR